MVFSKLRLIATLLLLAGAALAAPDMAVAQAPLTPRDRVIATLESEGYQVTRVRTTWLGRVQIRARAGDLRREVVLNPNTGEVLRDYIETVARRDDRGGWTGGARSDDDDGNDRSGSSRDGDDDDDDDDDDKSGSSDEDDDDRDDDDSSDDDRDR